MAMSTVKRVGAGTGVLGIILSAVFLLEGAFSNNPDDPGGATNHGITEIVARADGYTGRMEDLSKERAEQIYIKNYVNGPGFDKFLELSPALAHKLIDAGVNVGVKRPACWLQESLNAVNRYGQDYGTLAVDCQIGPSTVNAYKALQKKRGREQACVIMLKLIDAKQTQHYLSLPKLHMFTPGWIMNRIGNIDASKCKLTAENYK